MTRRVVVQIFWNFQNVRKGFKKKLKSDFYHFLGGWSAGANYHLFLTFTKGRPSDNLAAKIDDIQFWGAIKIKYKSAQLQIFLEKRLLGR